MSVDGGGLAGTSGEGVNDVENPLLKVAGPGLNVLPLERRVCGRVR